MSLNTISAIVCFTLMFIGIAVYLYEQGAFHDIRTFLRNHRLRSIEREKVERIAPKEPKPPLEMIPVNVHAGPLDAVGHIDYTYWEAKDGSGETFLAAHLPHGGHEPTSRAVAPIDSYVFSEEGASETRIVAGSLFRRMFRMADIATVISKTPGIAPTHNKNRLEGPPNYSERELREMAKEYDLVSREPSKVEQDKAVTLQVIQATIDRLKSDPEDSGLFAGKKWQ